ncbi:hypothetical protein GLOIN_2v1798242 [Rhizophagus irregularis DAOM 181602=DAOM 197198]|nr:hypothetical protein GLOIN_2v1798242 [Rhizophagus irregularis DAOM 181602=DAOM 197198]
MKGMLVSVSKVLLTFLNNAPFPTIPFILKSKAAQKCQNVTTGSTTCMREGQVSTSSRVKLIPFASGADPGI